MASSRKRRTAKLRVAVGLSGGLDSVVLLHVLKGFPELAVSAVHVHHGLSRNADAWAAFCKRLCKRLRVPLTVEKVQVKKAGRGLEAAAREARYSVYKNVAADVIAVAHHLDDQAETVLMNLLRGAGVRGASGMRHETPFQGKFILRPFLNVPREAIEAYAREHKLQWIEDESNSDEALTRNFIRRRVGPLLAQRFPAWKHSLARAARHFLEKDDAAQQMLRAFLRSKNLKAPSEAKLAEMLKQLGSGSPKARIDHDGKTLRVYRGDVRVESPAQEIVFKPVTWKGGKTLAVAALGGEIRFRRAKGKGIDAKYSRMQVRLRGGGERLQLDAKRPRRTLKNLFQEAGVPSWARERTPLLFHGDDLVWAAGLGVDVRFQAARNADGVIPEWRPRV
jgi:tRNA(Ile)-lysidine synthase